MENCNKCKNMKPIVAAGDGNLPAMTQIGWVCEQNGGYVLYENAPQSVDCDSFELPGNKQYMVISISHTDLDGYASQYLVHEKFKDYVPVKMYNVDYEDVNTTLDNVIEFCKNSEYSIHVYVTDLSLTVESFNKLNELSSVVHELTVIDHHQIPKISDENGNLIITASSIKFNFVHEIGKSATLLTHMHLNDNEHSSFVQCVDVYDMWKKDEHPDILAAMSYFADYVFDCPAYYKKRDLLFAFFTHHIEYGNFDQILKGTGYSFDEIESDTKRMIKKFLGESYSTKVPQKLGIIRSDKNKFMLDLLTSRVEYIKDGVNKELFVVSIPSSNYQYLSSIAFDHGETNPIVNLNFKRGSASVRSVNFDGIEISKMFGGGGHANASGFSHKFKSKEEFINFFKSLT